NSYLHFDIRPESAAIGLSCAKEVLRKSPALAKRHFLSWGMLYKDDPATLLQLQDAVRTAGVTGKDEVYGTPKIHPFPISHDQVELICLLAKGVVECFDYSHGREWSEAIHELSTAIGLFGLTTESLALIASNAHNDATLKASCQLLYIMCIDKITIKSRLITVLQDIQTMRSLINDETAGWYLEGLCTLMQKELGDQLPIAVAAAEELLTVARDRVALRRPLSIMLSVWREASCSPVDTTQSMQKWLDE
ncbi:hypothetical protein, partial [Limnobacter sp.]|uniref:hypothetical protein n=1 Tax=Limnobacter sp. TaxID=2003368 RepID=UPI002733EFBC